MKRLFCLMIVLAAMLNACALGEAVNTPLEVMEKLQSGNTEYLLISDDKVSEAKRKDTAENGQHPYAVVITCSDSRVPAELIFNAGIGELFVIRTAGNVIGEFELGSVEYGAEHLHVPLVVVLGHTHCGAVAASLEGEAHGNIAHIVEEILSCLPENCEAAEAEILNVKNSIKRIRESEIMQELEADGKTSVVGAIYDIVSGKVEFLKEEEQ